MEPITVVTDEVRRRLIEELTAPGGLFEIKESAASPTAFSTSPPET